MASAVITHDDGSSSTEVLKSCDSYRVAANGVENEVLGLPKQPDSVLTTAFASSNSVTLEALSNNDELVNPGVIAETKSNAEVAETKSNAEVVRSSVCAGDWIDNERDLQLDEPRPLNRESITGLRVLHNVTGARQWDCCRLCDDLNGAESVCNHLSEMATGTSSVPCIPHTEFHTVPKASSHVENSTETVEISDREVNHRDMVVPFQATKRLIEKAYYGDYEHVVLGLRMNAGAENGELEDSYDLHHQNISPLSAPFPSTPLSQTRIERPKYWEDARMKAKIVMHPRYPDLVDAHISCLRMACPIQRMGEIDEQLSRAHRIVEKYSGFTREELYDGPEDERELNRFMKEYTYLLLCLRDDLASNVHQHATQAMIACWSIEQTLYNVTGITINKKMHNGATMSDEEEPEYGEVEDYSGAEDNDDAYDHDQDNYGSLIPSETERSMVDKIRQDLKIELKQGYKETISEVRQEIHRKRRAGKLPEGTTVILKRWWDAHAKWPYPTEEDKEHIIKETNLELKQINNWFINQRKRNWHVDSFSPKPKNKRKHAAACHRRR